MNRISEDCNSVQVEDTARQCAGADDDDDGRAGADGDDDRDDDNGDDNGDDDF